MSKKTSIILHIELKNNHLLHRNTLINNRLPEDKLYEAVSLAKSIDLEIFLSEIIYLSKICPSNFIGKGKIDKIFNMVEENNIDLIVINTKISPIQQRNLEKALKCKVIDRTGLILEIFGARAKTKEGRLQVELAAQEYQKSRLVRSWTHLERQRSAFGFMGGPGEKQIESDKREIISRIKHIKKKLEKVVKTRDLHRKSREKIPYKIISLAGYTNAGKSTLFNYLTNASVLAEDKLFATLDPTMRLIKIPSGEKVILLDTVGFISDLPVELVMSFKSTLEEITTSDLILHIRDISCPDSDKKKQDVLEILENLLPEDKIYSRIIEVHNKIDILNDKKIDSLKKEEESNEDISIISSTTGYGIENLLNKIANKINKDNNIIKLNLSNENGRIVSWVYENSKVLKHTNNQQDIRIECNISDKNLGRLKNIIALEKKSGFIIQQTEK